jgi:dolichyl-phosphate-mannose-protein mannosyltransferase
MNKGQSNKGTGGGILGHNGMSRMNGLLNNWDMLLPNGDRYEDGDAEMIENERWKKEQITKRGWNSPTGQKIILIVLTVVAVLVGIWKLAVLSAVIYVLCSVY